MCVDQARLGQACPHHVLCVRAVLNCHSAHVSLTHFMFTVDCGVSERYQELQLHIIADDIGCYMLMVLPCAELTGKPANLRSHKR